MRAALRGFFADEERASRVLINFAVVVMVVCFVVAVAAMYFMQ